MADNKDKIPFGGRDWIKDGKYDNFDRMTDFYVYKKVTEDWKKNGAWDKQKKVTKHYSDPSDDSEISERTLNLVGTGMILLLTIWSFSENFYFGLVILCCLIYCIYTTVKNW